MDKNRSYRQITTIAILMALTIPGGCSVLGPSVVRYDRTAYNLSAAQAASDQILLNLLRLRDGEPAYVLELTSILSQFKFDTQANVGGWWNNINRIDDNAVNAYYGLDTFATQQSNWGLSAEYMESPTITYVPLQGENFAERFMQPIPIATLLALAEAGWRIDRVFDCCVQRVNDLNNGPVGDPRGSEAGDAKAFRELTDLLGRSPMPGHFDADATSSHTIFFRFDTQSPGSAKDRKRLAELLEIPSCEGTFKIVEGSIRNSANEISIKTRTLLGVMSALAQSSSTDDEPHRSSTSDSSSPPFVPWLQIVSSSVPQSDAFVQVLRKDRWFSIANSNMRSKRTFALLSYLSTLRASEIGTAAPIVTVPSR